jgi:hypothetical protein
MDFFVRPKIAEELVVQIKLLKSLKCVADLTPDSIDDGIREKTEKAEEKIRSLNEQLNDWRYLLKAGTVAYREERLPDELRSKIAQKYVQLYSMLDSICLHEDRTAAKDATKLVRDIADIFYIPTDPQKIRPMISK